MRRDEGEEAQMWAVLYDDGMSLTTASERVARSLAEAERQRGHRVTVRLLDDAETHPPGPENTDRPPEPVLAPEPIQVSGPAQAVKPPDAAEPAAVPEPPGEAPPPELPREPEPARAATPTRRRRLLLYALAAAIIIVAAALVDHWGALPRIGGNTSSSPTQADGPAHRSQLLPPLDQPPIMHFSNEGDATSTPAEPLATSAESPQSATGESFSDGPSAIARGG